MSEYQDHLSPSLLYQPLLLLLLITFVVMIALKIPIAYSLGLSSMLVIAVMRLPITSAINAMYGSVNSFSLLAVPLFMLLAQLMDKGGITDKLLGMARMAQHGDEQWREEYDMVVERHHQMIDTIIPDTARRKDLLQKVDALLEQLQSICNGVFLIHDLSKKTEDAIVSYGERLSSNIVASLVDGGVRMNSRDFIRTEKKQGKNVLDSELTSQLVREAFHPFCSEENAAKGEIGRAHV